MHRRGRGYTNTAVYLGQQRYPNWNEIVEQLYRVARLLVPWYQRHSSLPPTGYETRHRLGIRDASFLYDDRCTRFTECSAYDGKERENLEGVARSPRTTGIYRFTYRARSRDAYYAFPGSWPLGRACFVLGWKCSRAKNDSRTRPFVPRSTRLGSTATPRVVLFQTTSTAQHRKTYEHECRVIAGDADSTKCRQRSNHLTGFNPAACFTFYLPNEMQFVDVTSAQLWFYKEYDENDDLNQTFVLSELDHWDLDGNFEKNTVVAIFETDIGEGWVKADVSFTLNKWVEELRLNNAIQIACSTCTIDRDTAPVSVEQTLKPFLVIHTSPLPQRNRPKRNSNCLPEMKECCRDELYINFEDIGWSDWILHPSGYHAYFCRGSCSSAASLTLSGSSYNNVIRRLLTRSGNTVHRRSEIVPCCSPTQLSPIQLLYVDSNNTITQKTLPNMVVEACGCM
ncbi:activin beta chain dawdle isoform X1 [Ptiloglossa arizonensis]|uniref:activin beta chain dawdle isoform X1 n=1 Tax=Ptiloglossa arizonensis TaxID=3350558 RepID=UPI003FA10F85